MSLDDSEKKPSLKIANYFFEVGLSDDSLTKQLAKQLNEECLNNRKKLKRLLSNANSDLIAENKDFLQNYKRNENFSNIAESENSLSAGNANSTSLGSISSVYRSDDSIESKKSVLNDITEIKIPIPRTMRNSIASVRSTPPVLLATKRTSFAITLDNLDRDLPPFINFPETRRSSSNTNDSKSRRSSNTTSDESRSRKTSLIKIKSKASLQSQNSLNNKKLGSANTLDSLNLCLNENDGNNISPETLESNAIMEADEEIKEAEIAFNKKFPENQPSKLKTVNSMPLINSNSLKKSKSKNLLVRDFDDNAPLAYLKISLSKESLNEKLNEKPQKTSSTPTINSIHPLENKYSSKLLLRYPEKDYNDDERLTPYISMFCFPNDITLKYSLKKPYSTYHSFINTSLTGEKSYGVCVIIYEKIQGNVKKSYEQLLEKWINDNIDDNEKEYIIHIHTELEKQQEELEQTKAKLKELLYKNDFVTKEDLALHDDLSKSLNEISENIKLYEEILNTLGNKRFISSDNVYQPKCIGVTSLWPWYTILKDWLSLVIRETVGGFGNKICVPLERYIINILNEIPFPPPGKYEISISTSEKTLYFSQPPKNEIPLINNFSFYPTFRCLSHNNIIAITEMLLGERKMIFVSSYPALLTNVIETFCALIYPFEWKYNLIPVLPVKLLQYTHAPGPYIIGVLRECIEQMKEDLNEESCIIDIDNDMIEMGKTYDYMTGKEIEFPKIPTKEKKRLLTKLNKYAIAGVRDDIIITKSNLGSGKPLGVPKFMMYTYPNGDFISSSRSKIDSDMISQKLKAQSNANSTVTSTNNTLNRKMGKMIQNEIEINIMGSNSDISRLPFDLFSKKRIVGENKNQTISGIPTNLNHNNYTRSNLNINTCTNNEDDSDDSDEEDESPTSPKKKRDSIISRSLSAANLVNSNPQGHSRGYSVTATPFSNSEYLLFQNRFKNSNTKSNTISHNIITTANSITTFSENIGAKRRDGHLFKEFIPDASNFITLDSPVSALGCSYNDLSSDNEPRNFVIVPNISNSSNRYQEKSYLYKNTCDICEKYLFSTNMKILKCSTCQSIIHISCLSKISNFPCISAYNQPKIQSAFVKVFRNIFKNYRKYIIPANGDKPETPVSATQDNNNQLEWFNTTGFIKEAEKSHQEFLMLFKDTQAFAQFTLERAEKPLTDHSIQYFDELINYKRKKSKIYPKEISTFFTNKSDAIRKTVEAHKPNQDDLEYDDIMVKSEFFPDTLNERLLCEPRPCDNLLLPEDIPTMNEDITNTRTDNQITKKKQEYWSWFKIVKDTECQPEDPFTSLKFNTDEERKALLEKIYKSVSVVIRESTPANKDVLTSFSSERIEKKLDVLYSNVELLKRAADEQLVENSNEQKELHIQLKSLFELITIYEDHLAKRKQDSMIMKTTNIEFSDSEGSCEDVEIQSTTPKKNFNNQRVEIPSIASSKSSVSSPSGVPNPLVKNTAMSNPNILRTQTLEQ